MFHSFVLLLDLLSVREQLPLHLQPIQWSPFFIYSAFLGGAYVMLLSLPKGYRSSFPLDNAKVGTGFPDLGSKTQPDLLTLIFWKPQPSVISFRMPFVEIEISILFEVSFQRRTIDSKRLVRRQSAEIYDTGNKEYFTV